MSARPDPAVELDRRLLPFYPLIYVAWADGELAGEEVAFLREELEAAGLEPEALDPWLDPDAPPAADELIALLGAIQGRAAALDEEAYGSLGALGEALARAEGEPPDAEARGALVRVERALGLDGSGGEAAILLRARPLGDLPDPRPRFDVETMARFLDEDAAATRRRVRELLEDERFRHVYGLSAAEYREQVLVWLRILAEEGLGALGYPTEVGGADDSAAFVAAFETLAYFDLSLLVKFGVQFGLFGGSILQLGSKEQGERYLPDVATLRLPGCFAMTETGHGSNVQDLETTATYDPSTREFEIHTPGAPARKDYIGNAAAHGRLATVFAQLEVEGDRHGVHAFLVPIRAADGGAVEGVAIEDNGEKLGLQGVDNGRLAFDRVRVPRESLLDRFAWINDDGVYRSPIASPTRRFFTMLGTLVGGRVAVASAAVTASKVALTVAVRYGARRRQFGPPGEPERPILDYPAHQRRLLPAVATTYALNFAAHDLQRRYAERSEERRRIETDAAGLKAWATWRTTEIVQACREACGGQGYLAVNRFAALKADTDVFTTFEGDNTVLMQLVVKDLLTGFGQQFGDLGGLARFFADRARGAVTERNPIVTRKRDEEHLRDPEFQLSMLEARRDDLLLSLGRRVRHRVEKGMSGFDALVDCQNHALATAAAHVERDVLASFIEAEGRSPVSSIAETLEPLRALFALSIIEARRGWYLEAGYVDPPKTKAIRALVTRLCADLRPQAVPLVDAFRVPRGCLEGSIAL